MAVKATDLWRTPVNVTPAFWERTIRGAGGPAELASRAGYDAAYPLTALALAMLGAESSYLNVGPNLAAHDHGYEHIAHSILPRQRCRPASLGFRNVSLANLPNLICRQFGAALALARQLPSFRDHIGGIASRSMQEQVAHTNTRGIVAPMADVQAVGYRPIFGSPRIPGSASRFAGDREDAVSAFISAASPLPALTTLVHKTFKSCLDRGGVRRVGVSNKTGMATEDAIPTSNVSRRRRKLRSTVAAKPVNPRTLTGHFIDLLHRSVGCRARSVDALPGFCVPQFYHGGSYAS